MSLYRIESEIPIPGIQQKNNEAGNIEYKQIRKTIRDLLGAMKIGDSFAFPNREMDIVKREIQRLAGTYLLPELRDSKRSGGTKKFTVRTISVKEHPLYEPDSLPSFGRIWRIK